MVTVVCVVEARPGTTVNAGVMVSDATPEDEANSPTAPALAPVTVNVARPWFDVSSVTDAGDTEPAPLFVKVTWTFEDGTALPFTS